MWVFFFLFKQKTAYEMRISDWSSDVCSSDLLRQDMPGQPLIMLDEARHPGIRHAASPFLAQFMLLLRPPAPDDPEAGRGQQHQPVQPPEQRDRTSVV